MTLINLTHADIVLHRPGGPITVRRERVPAHVLDATTAINQDPETAVTIRDIIPGDTVSDLPGPVDGTRYLVARAVAVAASTRTDLLVPGPLHRDPHTGRLGATELIRILPIRPDNPSTTT